MSSRITNGHIEVASKKRKRSELSSRPSVNGKKSSLRTSSLARKPNSVKLTRIVPVEEDEDDEEEDVSGDDEAAEQQEEILGLEQAIIASSENYNHIVKLLEYVEGTNELLAMTASVSLCRTFVRLMHKGRLLRKRDDDVAEVQVVKWLKDRYVDYLTALGKLISLGEGTALSISMKLLKEDSIHLRPLEDNTYFPQQSFLLVVKNILLSTNNFIVADFEQSWLNKYADVRFEFLKTAATIASDTTLDNTQFSDNLFTILFAIKSFASSNEDLSELEFYLPKPTSSSKKTPVLQLTAHKRHFQECWLSLLRRPIDAHLDDILAIMPRRIIPNFLKPQLLMDFLTKCYDSPGASSILALDGLYILMSTKNLDYPAFYPKLYALLDSNVMHVRHRSKFFRLTDKFLSSTHLPSVLVASFIKRMSRLCLFATPASIVTIGTFVYNLLRLHPSCTFMIHRVQKRVDEEGRLVRNYEDPFDMSETDPMKTGALESCLWELETLRTHYHPNVAEITSVIAKQFTKQQYNMEDFLDKSYTSILAETLNKRVKYDPPVEFIVPKRIFFKSGAQTTNQDGTADVTETELVRLWDFS